MKIVVVASTFPATDTDEAPAFVKDLVIALKRAEPSLHIDVLAPQYLDQTPSYARHEHYDEHRFAYFWPRAQQRLAGRGIVPAIESNRALIVVVPFLFLFEGIALWRHVRAHRPDVIYAHWFTPQGVTAAIVSSLTGVPWVLTSHANDVRIWRKLPVFGRAVVRALLPSARRITAVSAATRDKMRAFFSDEEWGALQMRVAILPMGVDVSALSTSSEPPAVLKARHGFSGRRVLYFIGRLAEKKGVTFLLDAFARLQARDCTLVIAGDGPLRTALEAQARELGVADRVAFVGYVSGAKKLDLLWLADVVVVPSIETASGDSEGFPVVIMEALAAGKACVASDATGADSVLVDGDSGFIVAQRDAAALATKIDWVLGLDDAALQRVGDAARAAAHALDWPTIARAHYELLLAPLAPDP